MLLYGRLEPTWALERIQALQATAGAIALTMGDEGGAGKRELRRNLREAFPEATDIHL